MSDIAVAVISASGLILAGVLGVVLRNNRSSPESTAARDNGWNLLTGGMERRINYLEQAEKDSLTRANDQADEIRTLKEENAANQRAISNMRGELAGLRMVNKWLRDRVMQLTQFIIEHGHTPPAPLQPAPDEVETDLEP